MLRVLRTIWTMSFCAALVQMSWAQSPGIITPEDVGSAQAGERNTYSNPTYGFSLTKPEDWFLYTDEDVPSRGVYIYDGERTSFTGTQVFITPIPAGQPWVLVYPGVSVGVYTLIGEALEDSPQGAAWYTINDLLKSFQAAPYSHAQIGLPPTDIFINGTTWKKASLVVQAPIEEGRSAQVYFETYVCAVSNDKFLLASFTSRKDDAAAYLEDAHRIIQSIVLRTSL